MSCTHCVRDLQKKLTSVLESLDHTYSLENFYVKIDVEIDDFNDSIVVYKSIMAN